MTVKVKGKRERETIVDVWSKTEDWREHRTKLQAPFLRWKTAASSSELRDILDGEKKGGKKDRRAERIMGSRQSEGLKEKEGSFCSKRGIRRCV